MKFSGTVEADSTPISGSLVAKYSVLVVIVAAVQEQHHQAECRYAAYLLRLFCLQVHDEWSERSGPEEVTLFFPS